MGKDLLHVVVKRNLQMTGVLAGLVLERPVPRVDLLAAPSRRVSTEKELT